MAGQLQITSPYFILPNPIFFFPSPICHFMLLISYFLFPLLAIERETIEWFVDDSKTGVVKGFA